MVYQNESVLKTVYCGNPSPCLLNANIAQNMNSAKKKKKRFLTSQALYIAAATRHVFLNYREKDTKNRPNC